MSTLRISPLIMPYSAKRLRLFALTALVTPVFQTAGFAQQSLNLRDINSLQLKQVQPSSEDRNFIQGALAAGDTVFGDTSRRFDSFSFDGQAGQVMRITVTSASFVPVVLLVEESTGQVIGNQTGDANTVSLTQQLPQDGQYVLRVTSVEVPGEGDYQFQIVEIREVIRSETEADRLFNQGYDLALQGQFEAAISLYEQALAIYQEMSDRAGEMLTLLNLGLAHNAFGQYEQAISFYEPLLNFAQEDTANTESQLKQRQWEGDALGGLAISYRELGQYERAISLFQEQIPILQELEDRFEEGRALGRLGIAYRVSERYEQAIEVLLQRIDIAREIDDRAGEGSGLGNLGLAYDGLGQYEEAIEAFEQRLVITRELNQLDRESLTLGNMAETYVNLGEIEEAIALLQQGLKIAREINYTDQEVRILDRLESLSVFSTSTGSEILAVEDVLDENSREIALGFDDGEPVSRRLSNTHQIQGIAGQNILIHLESSDFVPYIVLVNETEGFAQQSTSETTLQDDAWVVATLPVDGTYDVWVTMQDPEGQGSYQLTITQADAAALLLSDAANYFRQASEQYDSKNFQEALRLNEQSLNLYRSDAVRERFEELSLMQESRLLGNIGNVYDGLREYETAIEFQEQAIDLKRQIEDHSGEAFSLNNLGRTYRRSGADDLAIKAYQQALMIWREINNSLGEAVSLRLLGDTYRSQYQYESAIDIYQQLVVARRLINDPFGEATALIHLGVSYKDSGQYQQAINSYQQALAIANNIGDRENASGALGNLANAYSALGNSQQAMEAYQKSLNIAREIGDREGEAITLNALGNLYTNLGQYRLSLDAYEQAILIHREINNRHGEANSLNSLGALYDLLGREQLAAELYEQSLLISQEVDDKAFEALTLSNLANINPYSQQSMDYRLRNREIIIEIEDPIGTARYFLNLGNWYLRNPEVLDFSEENFIIQPRFPQAIEAYQISLARYRALGLRGEEAHLLAVLGHTYLKLAQFDFSSFYQMAIDRYEESLAISREAMLPLKEANALSGLANAYIYAGNHTGAENVLIEVLTILDSLREGDLDDTNKIALFETQIGIYESLKSILLSQNRYEEALVASERARSRVLVEALSSRTLPQAQGEMANETSDLASIRHVARQQNATLVTYSKGNGIVRMWVVQPSGEITFKSVQVAPDVPRVETVETESGALETRAIPSEHPDLNELIIDSRQAIGVRGDRAGAPPQLKPEEIARRQAEQDEKLSQLHDILIDPIADLLPDDPNQPVVFIPQGELFLVPFPALKDDNGDYLIENHTILTAPSIQVLQLTHDIAASRSAASTDNPVIVGNPTMPTVTFLSEAGNFEDVQLNPLFGAQQEAQAVAEFLDAPALIGADATEAAVKQQIASADLIHLATHGLLEYGDPRETGSRDTPGAIALAPGSGEDGLLTSSEILQMDLQADLVVLSACDTGRGRITGDGVIGLSRSFVAAGVPSIIVSLWAVPDAPTADLMTEFYQQRDQGQTKAQALRQAMLITMQTHPDPRDWAAFTLIGESE